MACRRLLIFKLASSFIFLIFLSQNRYSPIPGIPFHNSPLHEDQKPTPSTERSPLHSRGISSYCQPVKNIMALKVHKCASSTLQNILFRYGDSHNLTFVLPRKHNLLGYPEPFNERYSIPLPSVYGHEFNIFCHHARWHKINIKQTMPKNSIFIVSIREPFAMFESLFDYFALDTYYNATFAQFVERADHYNTAKTWQIVPVRNPMMFDFGLDFKDFTDRSTIQRVIREINETFSLILLAEYMDESLVLLRNLLCWEWEDIVAFHVNARPNRQKKSANMTSATKEKVLAWNDADVQLYRFFLAEFRKNRQNYGVEKLREDVQYLRDLTQKWKAICHELVYSTDLPLYGMDLNGHRVSDVVTTCRQLDMNELNYTFYLRRKLWPNHLHSLF